MIWLRAALVCSVLVFFPGLVEQFEAPKAAVLRALGAAALAAWCVRRAWSLGSPEGPGGARRPSAFEWALLAWVGVEALTAALSVSPRMSLVGDRYQLEGLLTSAALAALALTARDVLAPPRAFERTVDLTLAAAALACIYALLQVGHLDPLPWARTSAYGTITRPFGPLGHPNLLGVVSAAACAWSVAQIVRAPTKRWAYVPALLLFVTATALTFSRAAWLGAEAGVGTAGALLVIERRSLRVSPVAVLVAVAIAVAIVALFRSGGWIPLFTNRAIEMGVQSGVGVMGSPRAEIWRTSLAAWRARPIIGSGPATYELVFPIYQTAEYWRREWAGLPFHSHSVYLHTLATRGLLGALAALAIAVATALAAWRAWFRRPAERGRIALLVGGIAAIGVAGGAGALGMAGALWLLVSAAALDAVAGEPGRKLAPAPRGHTTPAATPAATLVSTPVSTLVATLAAVVALVTVLAAEHRPFVASQEVSFARHTLDRAPLNALAAAEHGAELMPNDDCALETLSEARLGAFLRTGQPPIAEAEQASRRSTFAEPLRSQNWQQLGAVLASRLSRGDTTAVAGMDSAYAHAAALAPTSALPLIEYARWQVLLDRPAHAIAPARRALALYPREGVARATLASALLASGDRPGAAAVLEQIPGAEWHGRESDRKAAEEVLARLR